MTLLHFPLHFRSKDLPNLWMAAHRVAEGYVGATYTQHPLRDDLVQEATIHAIRYLSDYDPALCSAFAYLTRLVDYGCRYCLKRHHRRTRLETSLEILKDSLV